MLVEHILRCDRCGRIIDAMSDYPFHTNDDGDFCKSCCEYPNKLTYLNEFEIDPVMWLDKDNEAVLPKDLPENLDDFTLEKISDAEYMEYASMWSVYQRCEQGGVDCIADFATEDEAIAFKIMLEGIQRLEGGDE